MDKKLKNMLEEFLTDSDRLLDDYTDDENGNLIICSESFAKLTGILKEGLAIYNKIVEENLYADNFMVQNSLQVISEAASKIEISEENAKKLNTKKGPAVQALRAQIDKIIYPQKMWKIINICELYIKTFPQLMWIIL